MSDTTGRTVAISGTALVWAIVAMFLGLIAGVVILAVALPESQNPAALVGQLLASFALLTTTVVGLFKISKVEQQVNDTAEDTQRIVQQTNGQLDARVRKISYDSVRRALVDHLDHQDHDEKVRHQDPPF